MESVTKSIIGDFSVGAFKKIRKEKIEEGSEEESNKDEK